MKNLLLTLLGLFVVGAMVVMPDDDPVAKAIVTDDYPEYSLAAVQAPTADAVALKLSRHVMYAVIDVGDDGAENYTQSNVTMMAFDGFEPASFRKEDPGNWVTDEVIYDNSVIVDRSNSPPIVQNCRALTCPTLTMKNTFYS